MKINPQNKLRKNFFYNNLCIIVCIFCIVCLSTALSYHNSKITNYHLSSLKDGATVGPINITNKSTICRIQVISYANNYSTYISGEVLDNEYDTLYEFGKELWHESGYDSEGYWSEGVSSLTANLTFSEKGTYYIRFYDEQKSMFAIHIIIDLQKGSYIPHFQVGTLSLIFILLIWYFINRRWANEKLALAYEALKEAADD